jgi:hypothetical protein
VASVAAGIGPCWGCRAAARASRAVRRSCGLFGGIAVATACLRLRSAGWRATTLVVRQAASRDSRAMDVAGRWARRSTAGDADDAGAVAGAGVLEGAAARSASSARAASASGAASRQAQAWESHAAWRSCCLMRARPWRRQGALSRRHLHYGGGDRLSALAQSVVAGV